MNGPELFLLRLALGSVVLALAWLATRVASQGHAALRFRWLMVGLIAANLIVLLAPSLPAKVVHVEAGAGVGTATPETPWLLYIWAAGAALLLTRLVLDRFALVRLEREARPLDDPLAVAVAETIRSEFGIRRKVKLLVHSSLGSPATWGWRQPVIVLPVEAKSWNVDRRRAVLLHEFEHVRRFDAPLQTLIELLCALRWFDPMAWITRRELRRERELACDQRVVTEGAAPARYAAMLLDLYRRLGHRASAPGISAVPFGLPRTRKKSEIELRLDGLLDARGRGSRRASAGAGFALFSILPLASLTPNLQWVATEAPRVIESVASEPLAAASIAIGQQAPTSATSSMDNVVISRPFVGEITAARLPEIARPFVPEGAKVEAIETGRVNAGLFTLHTAELRVTR